MSDSAKKGAGRQLDFTGSVVAGSVSGLLSTFLTNPFDTLRTRMSASRDATGVGTKTLTCHVRSLFQDGLVSGLGVGLRMNLISSVPSNAIYLSSYKTISREARATFGDREVLVPFTAAFGAVCVTNGLLSPFFTVRTRVMIDGRATITGVVSNIMHKEGPRGFYRGALTNTGGRIVEEATFWVLYESTMRLLRDYQARNSAAGGGSVGAGEHSRDAGSVSAKNFLADSAAIVVVAGTCKTVGSTISYPYNVVMTHMREVDAATGRHLHNHIAPTVRFIYAKDGVRGFWKGLSPHLMRCALSKSTQVYFYEIGAWTYVTAQKMLQGDGGRK